MRYNQVFLSGWSVFFLVLLFFCSVCVADETFSDVGSTAVISDGGGSASDPGSSQSSSVPSLSDGSGSSFTESQGLSQESGGSGGTGTDDPTEASGAEVDGTGDTGFDSGDAGTGLSGETSESEEDTIGSPGGDTGGIVPDTETGDDGIGIEEGTGEDGLSKDDENTVPTGEELVIEETSDENIDAGEDDDGVPGDEDIDTGGDDTGEAGENSSGSGTSPEILAEYAETSMTAEVPEVTSGTVTEQLASLCGEEVHSGYWGDPVIDWESHINNVFSGEDPDTNPNLAYDISRGFGWADAGEEHNPNDDYYLIGFDPGLSPGNPNVHSTGWFNTDWGNIFSLQSSISTSASIAIRILASDVTITGKNESGENYSIESTATDGTAITIENTEATWKDLVHPDDVGYVYKYEGVTIKDTKFKATNGVTGIVRNYQRGGSLTVTNSIFENTDTALNIDANGENGFYTSDVDKNTPGFNGGTITVAGAETTITGDIDLSADGGNGVDGEFYEGEYCAATMGGYGGTIEVNVKNVNSGTIDIHAEGGDGGKFVINHELMDGKPGKQGGNGGGSDVGFGLPGDIPDGEYGILGTGGAWGAGGLGAYGPADDGDEGNDGQSPTNPHVVGTYTDSGEVYYILEDGSLKDSDLDDYDPVVDGNVVFLMSAGEGGQGGQGGDGGAGGFGGEGGAGGTIRFAVDEELSEATFSASGGDGGDAGDYDEIEQTCESGGDGGAGGQGGAGGNGGIGGKGGDSGIGGDGGDGGRGGYGGEGGTVQIWASSINGIVDINADGGAGGHGGDGGYYGEGKSPGNSGVYNYIPDHTPPYPSNYYLINNGEPGTIGNTDIDGYCGNGGEGGRGGDGKLIEVVLSGDLTATGQLNAHAIGGTGGIGGVGGGSGTNHDGLGGIGGEGGIGGNIHLWADDIAGNAVLSINGGDGGDGGDGNPDGDDGIGGNSPTDTLYIEAASVSGLGSIIATAIGGDGSTGGSGGHIYSTAGFGGGSGDASAGNGGGPGDGVVEINPASAHTPPDRPAFPGDPGPGPGPGPGNPTTQTIPDVTLTDNSSLSPGDRILDYLAQLKALGFTIDEADLFSVLVPEVPYYVIPAIDPDGVALWLVFTEQGALVSPVPGVDIGTDPLDPDLLLQITELAAFVEKVSLIEPSTLSDLTQTIDENIAQTGTAITSLLQELGYTDAAGFIERVLDNPTDRDLVAGWPCPYGYTEEQRQAQFKEDYMKNYLVVMEALLADTINQGAPEPDTGAGQLTAFAATIIKLLQNSHEALESNYNTLSVHAEGTPWMYSEMQVYLDNEAAYNPVEADLAALEGLSGVSGGLPEAGAAVISESDISGVPGLMQLIMMGKFPDDALTLAAAAFDEGILRYDLSGYVTERCRDYYSSESGT